MRYVPVIGIEIHAELSTATKVFCACENRFGGEENTRCCPRCSGLPGTLPLLGRGAVEYAVKAGAALGCKINLYSSFDRKNYFYPDLPKAYQITQLAAPICTDGLVTVEGGPVRINRIHIEEDAGKLLHDAFEGVSLADYNRCGVPLIEIVTEPDIKSAEHAKAFVAEVARRLKYAGVCDARMEEGSLRADVNISIMPEGSDVYGTRAEIKNLNSLKSIGRAVEYEITRQAEILDAGGKVIQETRRFNDNHGVTRALRSKEEAHDYRYFPEPDIMPVVLTQQEVDEIIATLPEMPASRAERYVFQYGLPEADALLLTSEKYLSDLFEEAVMAYPVYKSVASLIIVELLRLIGETGGKEITLKLSGKDIADTARLADEGTVSRNDAKALLAILYAEGGDAEKTARAKGFIMSNDTGEVDEAVAKIIAENEKAVAEYRAGSGKVFGFLMGQATRAIGRGANPALIQKALKKALEEK